MLELWDSFYGFLCEPKAARPFNMTQILIGLGEGLELFHSMINLPFYGSRNVPRNVLMLS